MRPASSLNREELARLHGSLREVLLQGIDHRGTTFRDYVDGQGREGGNQDYLKVYGRGGQPCFRCGHALFKIKIAGRTAVFCPECQK